MRPNAASCRSRGQTPPRWRMTAGVLVWRMNSSRSSASQMRRSNLSVSATVSAMESSDAAPKRFDCLLDMLDVRSEAEDGAADVEGAFDPRPAHHHAAFLLQMPEQAL